MFSAFWRDHQSLRYTAVGVWNTLFAYLAYAVVYLLLYRHVHYLVISVLAHCLAVINAYVCQRQLVFRSVLPWWPAFVRFNVVQLLVLGWGLIGIAMLVEVFHMHAVMSQLLIMTATLIGGYLLNRHYSFRQ